MDPRVVFREMLLERQDAKPKINGIHDGMPGYLMKTEDNGIPARNGSTAGKGSCKLCMILNDGEINETSIILNVFNPFSTPIQQNTFITVKIVNGSQLVVDAEDCS